MCTIVNNTKKATTQKRFLERERDCIGAAAAAIFECVESLKGGTLVFF